MAWNKNHFDLIMQVLKQSREQAVTDSARVAIDRTVDRFAEHLEPLNDSFDRERFITGTGGRPKEPSRVRPRSAKRALDTSLYDRVLVDREREEADARRLRGPDRRIYGGSGGPTYRGGLPR